MCQPNTVTSQQLTVDAQHITKCTASKESHLDEELSNTSVYTPGCLVAKRPFTVEPCVETTLLVGINTR